MKKISTLFKKDPTDLGRVINEPNPENQWVFDEEGVATRKYDGTACMILSGEIYKRYDVKKGKVVPEGAIPCQDPDEITGHWPHWVKCVHNDPADKWHFEGLAYMNKQEDGTYELIGPKINGNREQVKGWHMLVKHGGDRIVGAPLTFDGLRQYLTDADIEGIVFHHPDGRMCKIRKSDFGIKRNKA